MILDPIGGNHADFLHGCPIPLIAPLLEQLEVFVALLVRSIQVDCRQLEMESVAVMAICSRRFRSMATVKIILMFAQHPSSPFLFGTT